MRSFTEMVRQVCYKDGSGHCGKHRAADTAHHHFAHPGMPIAADHDEIDVQIDRS